MLVMKVVEQSNFNRDCFIEVVWESDKDAVPPLLFDVSAFKKAFTKNPNFFTSHCNLCNLFFKSLTVAHQGLIFQYFKDVKEIFSKLDEANAIQVVNELAFLTEKVFVEQLDIYPMVRNVVDQLPIVLPEMGDKGKRVQDSEKKTFTLEDYPQVHAVVLMCKLFLPLIGIGTEQLKNYCGSDRVDPSLYSILVGVFMDQRSGFYHIFEKIDYYVRSEVKKSLQKDKKQNANMNSSYLFNMTNQGYCEELLIEYVVAQIFCRKLVTFDLTQEEDTEKKSDVMVCICKACESITQSKLTSFRKHSEYATLYTQSSSRKGGIGIEDNTSILENGFRISGPADRNKFIEVSLKHCRERIFRANNINEKEVLQCKKFYLKNPYMTNPLSQAVIASLLGKFIGGSSIIPSIKMEQFTELMVVCQLVLIRIGLWDIAAMLSVKSSDMKIVNISPEATRNKNFERLNEFIDLKNLCPGFCEREVEVKTSTGSCKKVMERISIETQLQGIVSWATEYEHTYNLPTLIWEKSPFPEGYRPYNGDFIEIGFDFTKNLCKFFIYCHGDENDHLSQNFHDQMPRYTFLNREGG